MKSIGWCVAELWPFEVFHTLTGERTPDRYVILYSVQCCYAVHWTDNSIWELTVIEAEPTHCSIRRPRKPHPRTKHEVDRMTHCWVMAIWSFSHSGRRTVTGHVCDFILCPMLLCSALDRQQCLRTDSYWSWHTVVCHRMRLLTAVLWCFRPLIPMHTTVLWFTSLPCAALIQTLWSPVIRHSWPSMQRVLLYSCVSSFSSSRSKSAETIFLQAISWMPTLEIVRINFKTNQRLKAMIYWTFFYNIYMNVHASSLYPILRTQ